MYVGENDTAWKDRMDRLENAFNQMGQRVYYEVLPNVGHVLRPLKGEGAARVFDRIAR